MAQSSPLRQNRNQQTRPTHRTRRTRSATSQKCSIIEHLCEVKKASLGMPAAASAYTTRSVTVLSPVTNPSALQYYLGRRTTFLTTKQRAIHLQTGGGLRFFTEPYSKQFYDQPKAPLPLPAPNISLSSSNVFLSILAKWRGLTTANLAAASVSTSKSAIKVHLPTSPSATSSFSERTTTSETTRQ
jgi:hypothetical protein